VPAGVAGKIWEYAARGGRVLVVPESLLGDVRIPAMSIGRSDGMSITIPGDVDNAPGAKRRR